MTGVADGGLGWSGGMMQPTGPGTLIGLLSGKGLQAEIGALRRVDTFPHHAPAHSLCQARIGTA